MWHLAVRVSLVFSLGFSSCGTLLVRTASSMPPVLLTFFFSSLTCVCVCVRACACVCECVKMHAQRQTHMVCVCVCVRALCTCVHTHTRTHTHTPSTTRIERAERASGCQYDVISLSSS
jgi:hypothetical protein